MDRETHRAYVEAGYAPIAYYVAKYGPMAETPAAVTPQTQKKD